MAISWSREETKAFIAMWGQESVQNQLERIHQNRDDYQQISMELEDYEYDKLWQQCPSKIKSLSQRHRKVFYCTQAISRVLQ